jgi:hypothetical protein
MLFCFVHPIRYLSYHPLMRYLSAHYDSPSLLGLVTGLKKPPSLVHFLAHMPKEVAFSG